MSDLREQFENLPEIKRRMYQLEFKSDTNSYLAKPEYCMRYVNFVNGAWYAYQEQQKKIDSLLDKVCGTHEDFLNEFRRCNTLPK